MSSFTSNLNLIKPSGTDNINVENFNTNFDIIDNEFGILKQDYIVSQGIQNGWTFRRFASGIMECWGTHTFPQVTFAAKYWELYYVNLEFNLPIVFKEPPTIVATPFVSTGLLGVTVHHKTNTSCKVYISSSRSYTENNVGIELHMIGRWK